MGVGVFNNTKTKTLKMVGRWVGWRGEQVEGETAVSIKVNISILVKFWALLKYVLYWLAERIHQWPMSPYGYFPSLTPTDSSVARTHSLPHSPRLQNYHFTARGAFTLVTSTEPRLWMSPLCSGIVLKGQTFIHIWKEGALEKGDVGDIFNLIPKSHTLT